VDLMYNIITDPPHRSSLCFTLPVSRQEIVRDPAGVAIMPQQLPGVFYSELLFHFTQVDDLVLDFNAGVGGLCAAALLNSRNCISTESSTAWYTSLIAHLRAIESRPTNWCYLQISQLEDENNVSTQPGVTASLDISASDEPVWTCRICNKDAFEISQRATCGFDKCAKNIHIQCAFEGGDDTDESQTLYCSVQCLQDFGMTNIYYFPLHPNFPPLYRPYFFRFCYFFDTLFCLCYILVFSILPADEPPHNSIGSQDVANI